MKVKLSEIPASGLTLSELLDPSAMQLETPEIHFVAPLKATATFTKERDAVVVQVECQGEQECVCGRCLEVYSERYDNHFDLGYPVKGLLALDVTDDIRQEILLSYPVTCLCRNECKGLCPQCGKNLNSSLCECKR